MTKSLLIYGEGEKLELELSEILETMQNLRNKGELIYPKLYY